MSHDHIDQHFTYILSRSRDFCSTFTLIVHVLASLDKVLYDDYLCLEFSKFEQATNSVVRSQETTEKLGNGQQLSGCGFKGVGRKISRGRINGKKTEK